MRRTFWFFSLLLMTGFLGGCQDPSPQIQPAKVRKPADPLSATEVEKFIAIVESHPDGKMPTFTPPSEEREIDPLFSADRLMQEFRTRFRTVYDPIRQGTVWARDGQWSPALIKHKQSPTEFAGLVASISCAITRQKMAQEDLAAASESTQADVKRIAAHIREIDGQPKTEGARSPVQERTQAVFQLEQQIALLEFLELLRQVPPENLNVIAQYQDRLQPLVQKTEEQVALDELAAAKKKNPSVFKGKPRGE